MFLLKITESLYLGVSKKIRFLWTIIRGCTYLGVNTYIYIYTHISKSIISKPYDEKTFILNKKYYQYTLLACQYI